MRTRCWLRTLATVLALLDERRDNVITQRTRLVNQLHALLRDLIPGGAPTDLTAASASRLLTGVRPTGPVETARKQLARDLVTEIRVADQRLKALTAQIADDGRRHRQPADRGQRGRAGRRRPAARPHPAGEPVPDRVSVRQLRRRRTRRGRLSADRARHRLPRGGDRQLNLALHIVALTQVRMRGSSGRAYYDTKIAAGKTHNEAMRCLKRRLADHVWRLMIRDERTLATGPGGQSGAALTSSAAGSTPTTSSSDKSLPEPATPDSTTARPAA